MSAPRQQAPSSRQLLRDPLMLLAFGFGTGLSPVAPGTLGSLLAIVLAAAVLPLPAPLQWLLGALLVAFGIWLCGAAAKRLGVHDHGGIVWDEIAAMYLILLTVPPSIAGWTAAFVLFRLFDIWKPWPIRDLDHRLHGGLGIMLDDLLAALFAASILGLGRWLMS